MGQKFSHAQGLRQEDPVSPLLFVIAMDVLTSLITKAQECGMLSRMSGCTPMQRLSIYADDVVLFVRPTVSYLRFVKEAPHIFGNASGLHINYAKSMAIMIRDEDGEKELV